MNKKNNHPDKELALQGRRSIRGKIKGLGRWWPFLGPAFMAATAYFDPGNFVVNFDAGARFGYQLVWVVFLASIMGLFIQLVSAKLGVATGKSLAELCREKLPRWVSYSLWGFTEVIILATDLSDFLGAALGFHLLFGTSFLVSGIFIMGICFTLLTLHQFRGFRMLEVVITSIVLLIVCAFASQVFLSTPDVKATLKGFIPSLQGQGSVYLTAAIVGSTIMPHVIFLHSALTQKRVVAINHIERKKLFRFQIMDVSIAMGLATLINIALVILAAAVFFSHGIRDIHVIQEASTALGRFLGSAAVYLFGLSLLLAGIISSTTGMLAGKICLSGFMGKNLSVLWRRFWTAIPSLVILSGLFSPTKAMVFTQVILAFGVPFSLLPLIYFSKRKSIMGPLANQKITTLALSGVTVLVVSLNLYLLVGVI